MVGDPFWRWWTCAKPAECWSSAQSSKRQAEQFALTQAMRGRLQSHAATGSSRPRLPIAARLVVGREMRPSALPCKQRSGQPMPVVHCRSRGRTLAAVCPLVASPVDCSFCSAGVQEPGRCCMRWRWLSILTWASQWGNPGHFSAKIAGIFTNLESCRRLFSEHSTPDFLFIFHAPRRNTKEQLGAGRDRRRSFSVRRPSRPSRRISRHRVASIGPRCFIRRPSSRPPLSPCSIDICTGHPYHSTFLVYLST